MLWFKLTRGTEHRMHRPLPANGQGNFERGSVMSITTSRRSFVKGAGAGIAAVAATSMISGVAFADDAKASEVKDGT